MHNKTSQEVLNEIIELKGGIAEIPNSENFDGIWELDFDESEIISLIYNYCLSKNYNIDGFPEKYLALIAEEDPDFGDFLSFDVKYYYSLRNAVIHEDVFVLMEAFFNYPKEINFTREVCKEAIALEIYLLETRDVNLTFNRADYNTPVNKWRPKLP